MQSEPSVLVVLYKCKLIQRLYHELKLPDTWVWSGQPVFQRISGWLPGVKGGEQHGPLTRQLYLKHSPDVTSLHSGCHSSPSSQMWRGQITAWGLAEARLLTERPGLQLHSLWVYSNYWWIPIISQNHSTSLMHKSTEKQTRTWLNSGARGD